MYTDDSVVTKMVAVLLLRTTGNVRCTVTGQRYDSLLKESVIPALKASGAIKLQFLCRMVLRHISHLVRNNFSTAILVTKELSGNFPQLDLLDLQTIILPTIGCENILNQDTITTVFNLKQSVDRHVRDIPQFMLPTTIEHEYASKW